MKRCTTCNIEKPTEQFYRSNTIKSGRLASCKPCVDTRTRRYARTAPGRQSMRKSKLRGQYGLTLEQYEAMMEAQGGVCAICAQPERQIDHRHGTVRSLSVDHDRGCCPGKRSCGRCVRGLLCVPCNSAIGRLGDTPEGLRAAVDYLEAYAARHLDDEMSA